MLTDCGHALELNSQNTKAYYRSARACFLLKKYEEALDAVDRSLTVEANNASMLQLKMEIEAAQRKDADRRATEQQRMLEKEQQRTKVLEALKV